MGLQFEANANIPAIASRLYAASPPRTRVLQRLRPYICPFDDLLAWAPPRGDMLDIGCGAGLFLGLVGRFRPEVTAIGFDTDETAVDAARGMVRAHFPDGRIRFDHINVDEDWPEGAFDAVSMIDVLHHIPPVAQERVIGEAFAHVRPGGCFIYKDMAERPLFRAWWNRLHDLVVARQWIHYRAIAEVEGWLRGVGAEIVKKSSRAMGPYGHELLVSRKPA